MWVNNIKTYIVIDPGNDTSIDEFNEDSRSYSLDVKPNVTYSFTRWVNGNFYFVYEVSGDKNTGRTEEKDFGLSSRRFPLVFRHFI